MSLIQFWRILAARRLIILLSLVSCVAAAWLVASILPVRYESQARLLLDIVKPDPVTGEVIATQFARAYTKTQVEMVRSEPVAGQVIDALELERLPALQTQYQASGAASGISFRDWLTRFIMNNSQAKLIEGSNLLEVSYTAPTPDLARQVAEALRRAFVDATLASRRQGASRTAEWYAQQTEKARQALETAEAAKTKFEHEKGLILEAGSDVDNARLQALAGATTTGGASIVAPAPLATPTSAQLIQVDAAIAQASQTLGPNHPQMQELQRRRVELAAQVSQERAAAGSAANAAARMANAGANAASRAYQAQRSKVVGQRQDLEELRRLQSEVDVRRDQYTKTASRTAELRQQADVADAGLTIIGTASTPTSPAFPNKPLILGGAFAFGLAFGVLLALLLELLNRRVRSVEDMTGVVGVPLLAVISPPARGRGEVRLLGWSGRS